MPQHSVLLHEPLPVMMSQPRQAEVDKLHMLLYTDLALLPQGNVIWIFQVIATFLGMMPSMKRLAFAHSLEEQRAVWNGDWFVSFCKQGPVWLVDLIIRLLAFIFLNRFVLW